MVESRQDVNSVAAAQQGCRANSIAAPILPSAAISGQCNCPPSPDSTPCMDATGLAEFRPGDIAACHGRDAISRLIRAGTAAFRPPRLGPSHVAILCPAAIQPATPQGEQQQATRLLWVESTTFCPTPCLMQERRVKGVQVQRIEDRIGQYRATGGRVDLYRLSPLWELDREEQFRLTMAMLSHVGLGYDLRGAIRSGTRLYARLPIFPPACLESLFCSELLAAVLMRLGRLNHANPTRYNPARLLRELVATGKYHLVRTYP